MTVISGMSPMGATPFAAWPELSLMPRLPGNNQRNASGHARPPMKDNKSGQNSQDSSTARLCADHNPSASCVICLVEWRVSLPAGQPRPYNLAIELISNTRLSQRSSSFMAQAATVASPSQLENLLSTRGRDLPQPRVGDPRMA